MKYLLILFCIAQPLSYTYANSWTQETFNKHARMVEIGFTATDARYVIDRCKETTKNPALCVAFASGIAKHETNVCRHKLSNGTGCWGLRRRGRQVRYSSITKGFDDWLRSYNKYWYQHQTSDEFIDKSHYAVNHMPWRYNVRYYKYYILTGNYD